MRAIFQASLRQTDGSSVEVMACDIDFIRQSPRGCVLQYTLGLREPVTGSTRDQVVTGVMHRSPQALMSRVERGGTGDAATIANGPLSLVPYVYVPELAFLIQVFPYDHQLPGLAPLLEGWSAFEAALLAELDLGDWQILSRANQVVRYRPTMRAMVRLELHVREAASGHAKTRRAYAKVFADNELGQQVHRLLQA
ncbi:MAG: hypothetical protein M3Q75_13210, partial [Gemmatimonadota bacterium]|nr:hypothetical protein [Gemmatimonadota bacterium]